MFLIISMHFVHYFRVGHTQLISLQSSIQLNIGIPVSGEGNGLEIEYIQAQIPGV